MSSPFGLVLLSALATPPVAPVPACVKELGEIQQRNDFQTLVASAERCRAETGHPRTHYFVGVGQLGLEHRGHAIVALRHYEREAAEEPARIREVAALRLQQAVDEAGSLALQLVPAPAGEVNIVAEREDQEEPTLLVPLGILPSAPEGALLSLDRGRYRIKAVAAGYTSAEVTVVVDGQKIVVRLVPRAAPHRPPPPPTEVMFPRRPWYAATLAGAGILVVTGAPSLAFGATRLTRVLRRSEDLCAPIEALNGCRRDVAAAVTLRGVAAGLLGAGLGVTAGSLVARLSQKGQRRLAWSIGAAAGGVLALVGATVLGTSLRTFNTLNNDNTARLLWGDLYRDSMRSLSTSYTAGAGLFGAGLGLGVSSAVGLFLNSRTNPRSTRWQLQPQGVALRF